METEFTKSFAFSASYRESDRSVGRNYTLLVTVGEMGALREREFEETVRRELISLVHTRDLSDGVDFLMGIEKADGPLLRGFWSRLSGPLAPYKPKRVALQRDARTVTTLIL